MAKYTNSLTSHTGESNATRIDKMSNVRNQKSEKSHSKRWLKDRAKGKLRQTIKRFDRIELKEFENDF